jgi:hypothetical protein
MIHWNDEIDPKSIPDPTLYSEVARRRGAKRKTFGGGHGRPKVLKPCPVCKLMLGTVEMRKHRKSCKIAAQLQKVINGGMHKGMAATFQRKTGVIIPSSKD